MEYTRSEILAAREAWIEYLMNPHRRKYRGKLANPKRCDERCCLGHGMHLFYGLKYVNGSYQHKGEDGKATFDFVEKVGLWNRIGRIENDHSVGTLRDIEKFVGKFVLAEFGRNVKELDSLTRVNDWTRTSPQRIGEYLLHVIEGGEDTPFRPLSDYSE
uniref:Uncharacterized protein n=1 Tax=Ochrobactrum phage ORM_20 TaxID=2985243 RepID=A0A9N6WU56_9VIRU|nr:hypothetical protein ORM20_00223 [Ochrobactrum phage ORM_20]